MGERFPLPWEYKGEDYLPYAEPSLYNPAKPIGEVELTESSASLQDCAERH